MVRRFVYFWDPTPDGNIEHVADGDVTQDEFEEVLERGFEYRVVSRSNPRRLVVRGQTDVGRYLVVVFELDDLAEEGAWGITPVTAFPPERKEP